MGMRSAAKTIASLVQRVQRLEATLEPETIYLQLQHPWVNMESQQDRARAIRTGHIVSLEGVVALKDFTLGPMNLNAHRQPETLTKLPLGWTPMTVDSNVVQHGYMLGNKIYINIDRESGVIKFIKSRLPKAD